MEEEGVEVEPLKPVKRGGNRSIEIERPVGGNKSIKGDKRGGTQKRRGTGQRVMPLPEVVDLPLASQHVMARLIGFVSANNSSGLQRRAEERMQVVKQRLGIPVQVLPPFIRLK
jgi:hypothetical protein